MNVKKVRKTSKGIGIGVILRVCAGAVLRGGNWNNDVNTGVFASNLNNAPTNTNTNIGFRCVFVPGFWVETGWNFWRARNERARSFSSRNFLPLGNFSLPLLGHTSIERLLNTWDLKNLFLLISLFFSFGAIAREIDKVNTGDTIEIIAKRNLPRVWTTHGKDISSYAEDIKKWNPNIKDWNNPPVNQLIYVTYPYDAYASGSSWAPMLPMYKEPNEFNRSLHVSAFYATSFGTYAEQTTDQNVKSGQNFPVTFGLSGSISDDEKVNFVIGSFYWAQPSKGSVKGNSESLTSEFSIPGEVGGNLYYQNYNRENGLGFYTGYDYESLNTFNTAEIVGGDTVKNINNQMHYGTMGVVSNFDVFKMNFNVRASYSYVLASSSDSGKNLSGSKYILALTYKPDGRFSFGAFYKHHDLEGTTKLSIDRIGFNVGIIVF